MAVGGVMFEDEFVYIIIDIMCFDVGCYELEYAPMAHLRKGP